MTVAVLYAADFARRHTRGDYESSWLTSDREGATPAKRSSSYSLLIVTPEGKVMRKRRILARDDAEAAQCAKALRCEWNLELWKGSTLIGEFPALP